MQSSRKTTRKKPNQKTWNWWQEEEDTGEIEFLDKGKIVRGFSVIECVVSSFREDINAGDIEPEEVVVNERWLRINYYCPNCKSKREFAYDLTANNSDYRCMECNKQIHISASHVK